MKSVSHRPPHAKTLRVNSTLEWRKEGKKENATVIPTGSGPIPRTLVLSTAHKGPEGIPGPHPKKKKKRGKGSLGVIGKPNTPWQREEGGRQEQVRREIYTYLLNGILLTKDAEYEYFFTWYKFLITLQCENKTSVCSACLQVYSTLCLLDYISRLLWQLSVGVYNIQHNYCFYLH